MNPIKIKTLTDEDVLLEEDRILELEEKLRGELINPRDDRYNEVRTIWNAMIEQGPALIIRCAGDSDVMEAVKFAREYDLLIAVRGGGHSIAGASLCEGGLMIDLSMMRSVHVDPKAQTVRVEGGATGGDLDHETQAFGLAVPFGVVSTTGVGGLTLGGGFGRLSRKYGLAADNLLSVDLVTAEGERITVSAEEHSDLFWGIRGGGGNFGITTSFEFKLHKVGPQVLFGPIIYSLKDAPEVLRNYRDFAMKAPNECSVWADILTAPPLPILPEEYHGTKVLFVAPFYIGDPEKGKELIKPLREFGNPLADGVDVMPYAMSQRAVDVLYTKGMRNYWKSHNFVELGDEVLDTIVNYGERLPTPQSDILISHLGGAINEKDPEDTAYPHRDIEFVVTPGGRWMDPEQDSAPVKWVRECHHAMKDQATGRSYVNFIAEGKGREQEAFGPNYDRLVELKNKYDPTDFFLHNRSITPTK